MISLIQKKRPYLNLDKHFPLIILTISVLSIIKSLLTYYDQPFYNLSLSLLISLLGIAIYFSSLKHHKYTNLLILLWSIPQLIIIIKFDFVFNLTQLYEISIPFISISFESDTLTKIYALNILSFFFIYLAVFRVKNSFFYKNYNITLLKDETLNVSIENVYSFGKEKEVYILKKLDSNVYYSIYLNVNQTLKNGEHLLYEVNSKVIKDKIISPYEMKQIGLVLMTSL
jgi:hypothetical protein